VSLPRGVRHTKRVRTACATLRAACATLIPSPLHLAMSRRRHLLTQNRPPGHARSSRPPVARRLERVSVCRTGVAYLTTRRQLLSKLRWPLSAALDHGVFGRQMALAPLTRGEARHDLLHNTISSERTRERPRRARCGSARSGTQTAIAAREAAMRRMSATRARARARAQVQARAQGERKRERCSAGGARAVQFERCGASGAGATFLKLLGERHVDVALVGLDVTVLR
jgi:hypothetical protein